MKNFLINQKGLGIVAAILIMLIIGVMGATLASVVGDNSMSSVNYLQSQQAFFLAESGVQAALLQLSRGAGAWTGWSGTDPKTIQLTLTGYGDYNISVAAPTSSTPVITSTGYVPSRTAANKAVRVVNPTATNIGLIGTYAAFAGESGTANGVTLSNGSSTDSYDSSKGTYNVGGNISNNGDVGTNANISVSFSSFIGGDASTGPSGTFSNTSLVSGSITHTNNVTLPAVVVPSSLTSLTNGGTVTNTTTINAGNYQYTEFSGTKTITIVGPANIYLTGSTSINLTTNGTVAVSALSTGPVVIYAAGAVDASNAGGLVNNTSLPSDFQLYDSSVSAPSISLSGPFYGVVYAPDGNLSLIGNADFYGAFIGDVVSLSTQASVHLDQNLMHMSLPSFLPSGWEISGWQEVY
jgi:hypothetical protein